MGKRLLTFFAVLVGTITLKHMLTTGQQKGGPINGGKHNPANKDVPSQGKQTGSDDEQQIGSVSVIELKSLTAAIDQYQAEHKANKGRDIWTFRLEVVAFFVLFGTLIASIDGLRLTRQALHIDQRAWVSVPRQKINREPESSGGQIAVSFEIRNTGKTPASAVTMRANIRVDTDNTRRQDWSRMRERNAATIFPSSDNNAAHVATLEFSFAPNVAVNYRENGASLQLRVLVTYYDAFGAKHWTESCTTHLFGQPLDLFTYCGSWNAEGDGEPPP